ncbi:MAG: hypothetical protein A3G87_08985 [Omnitrophica bacterium RIFCSPLOWO2_12_FULL_50_11]|nr:MAG: hypothetical protein A3G87_08985 [Omnitrophica bacterium RIFCSPLOWO2_12_FULL_50_11]
MFSHRGAWFFLPLFLSLVGCAMRAPLAPYDTIPQGKASVFGSRLQLIDDFNAGIGRNKVDTEWQTWASNGADVKLLPAREDALNPWGASAALQFSIPKGESVKLIALLEDLDVSQAEALSLLVRRKDRDAFSGEISIRLEDDAGRSRTVDIDRYRGRASQVVKPEWDEVVIPKSEYRALDFNRLERIEILLQAREESRGRLFLDEIAFFGVPDIVFESARDNLVGFPEVVVASKRRTELLQIDDDRRFLKEIARDTWRYFENLVDRETGLPVDHIRIGEATGVGGYVSPANVGLYWLAAVAASDLSLTSKGKAAELIRKNMDSFTRSKRWKHGFWYNFYKTRSLRVTRDYVSTVDNGWLAAALVVLRQAFPREFGREATGLLELLDFSEFYDPSNGQIRIGFDGKKSAFAPYHYGLLATEARLVSYVAIGKGDLDRKHWARIYRTLPVEWNWQKQEPQGSEQILFGETLFEGYYTYLDKRFVPSWGGSLFEFLAPLLVVDEQKPGASSLGKNNLVVTDLHMEHALEKKGYPVWGLAPCAIQSGRGWSYREYGIPELGAKGYRDDGVIAPYASFLALGVKPEAAIRNIRELLSRYEDLYGEYGFYDSVHALKGRVNHQYLMLDQAMIFMAITNYLQDGVIQKYFHSDPIGQEVNALLEEEKFSI